MPSICPKCAAEVALSLAAHRKDQAYVRLAYVTALRDIANGNLELCTQHKPTPEQEIAKLQTVLDSMTAAGLLRRR